jgi:long-chain acyl-CoA synthetase
LKFSPYIKEAVVIGKDRPYVVALINIDMANVGRWAENNHLAYTTYVDLSQKPEVIALITNEVQRVNNDLPAAVKINRFVILHKELDADDEELTRTRKVRFGYVTQKYGDLVGGLYEGVPEISIETKVKYRDGREAMIQTALKVVKTGEAPTRSAGEVGVA